MLCRACQKTEPRNRDSGPPPSTRKRDELCSRCGQLLAPDHMVRRVRDKLIQLARFGLDATRGALLERRSRKE